jgi:hypothetical protein
MKNTIHDAATGEVWEEEQDDALFDTTELDISMKRNERDALLSQSDWRVAVDAPGDRDAWIAYRQELRDLPAHPDWPNVEFPDPPEAN